MIRRLVNWFLYTLHIRERKSISAIVSLVELLPLLTACAVIMHAVVAFGPFPRKSSYKRIMLWVKYHIQHLRRVVVGY